MSDTPRTDAVLKIMLGNELGDDGELRDLSRQLERELNAAAGVTAKFIADLIDAQVMLDVMSAELKKLQGIK